MVSEWHPYALCNFSFPVTADFDIDFFSNIQIDLYQVTIIVIAMGNNIVFLIFLRTRFLKNILHLSIEQYMKKFVGFIIYMTLIYRLLVT